MITTYSGDGDPLPSFCGEPVMVAIPGEIGETRDLFWSLLNEANRVSLLVKFISPIDGSTSVTIVNKHELT